MTDLTCFPDYVFEASWEVCNKVGGIYTVLSSRAKTLKDVLPEGHLVFIGPDVMLGKSNPYFKEDKRLLTSWKKAASKEGLEVRVGKWLVPGEPLAVLIDFSTLFEKKNEIYATAWENWRVDSIKGYGDYDEASMFSVSAGMFVAALYKANLIKNSDKVVYQAHEWMSGLGMLWLKKEVPSVATIFTTHATSIGRSIAGNNKQLYAYFEGYNGDQMAEELHMDAKHSIEKQSAHRADCFTTVSSFTDKECAQLLDKPADVVLPNGFEQDFVFRGTEFTAKRRAARKLILDAASALTGEKLPEDTLIVSTSGRNDFRCKGFDVYLESLAQLRARNEEKSVLALIEVPCWMKEARKDLTQRLSDAYEVDGNALPNPFITHDLHNLDDDRIVCLIRELGLDNKKGSKVKVMLVPCYLEGFDGVFNRPYYELLTANDLCIYPSYYEPWGYTPLESCAFGTPCITTDLSGFGQWVDAELGHSGELSDSVKVLHRDDSNYFEVAGEIASTIEEMLALPAKEITKIRTKAKKMAERAAWKNFIKYYYEAYDFALSRVHSPLLK